jgi:group I intron endonuclease
LIGIYKITNNITGQSYIGQSKNIANRFKAHIQHNDTLLSKDIKKYGKENFTFEVLEECTVDKLDEREDYYILKYDTIHTGYNLVRGGQSNIGESNANAKLTEQDVYNIRECYNRHMDKHEVYKLYGYKLTWLSFSSLWEGSCWKNIHYDVYTKENIEYYSKKKCIGSNSKKAKYTGEEVLEFREKYADTTAAELYKTETDRIGYDAFQKMLWGKTYRNVPIIYPKQYPKM